MNNSSPAICCIVTNNYAADAACLADHVLETNPGLPVYGLVIGDLPAVPQSQLPVNLHWVHWSELLSEQDRYAYASRYSGFQLSCATRGLFHTYMHTHSVHDRWLMLDGDMAVLAPLSSVWKRLAASEILLTPHATKPVTVEDVLPHEIAILDHGIFNGGFFAMRRGCQSLAAANWLTSRLEKWCYSGPLRTTNRSFRHLRVHDDQLWLNLIPIYFENVALLRDEVYNLGHWNLHQGSLEFRNGAATFDGRPVVIAHFSGVDPKCPEKVSRWTNLYDKRPSQAWADLFQSYDRRRSRWREMFGPVRYTYEKPVGIVRRLARAARRRLSC